MNYTTTMRLNKAIFNEYLSQLASQLHIGNFLAIKHYFNIAGLDNIPRTVFDLLCDQKT